MWGVDEFKLHLADCFQDKKRELSIKKFDKVIKINLFHLPMKRQTFTLNDPINCNWKSKDIIQKDRLSYRIRKF